MRPWLRENASGPSLTRLPEHAWASARINGAGKPTGSAAAISVTSARGGIGGHSDDLSGVSKDRGCDAPMPVLRLPAV